jgi:hypothetical protein
VLAAVAATAALTALSVEPAAAGITGPCTATIGGTDVAGLSTGPTSKAVVVKQGDDVVVTMRAGRPMNHLKITLSFSGLNGTVTIEDKDISSSSWSETVEVDRYAKWGKGLYLVKGESTGNGFSCSGAALVEVEGNPLSSVAGAIGLGMAILGIAGVGVAGVAAYRTASSPKRTVEAWTADQLETLAAADAPAEPKDERTELDEVNAAVRASTGGFMSCWTLALPAVLLTTGAMIGGGGAPETPAGPRLERAHWRPKLSLFGLLAGLVGGVGVGVLLQQYGVVYPTDSVTIVYLVVGLLTGLVVPSIGRYFGVRAVNRAVDNAERRLASARA